VPMRDGAKESCVTRAVCAERVLTGWSACYGSFRSRRPRNATANPSAHTMTLNRGEAMARWVGFCGTGVVVPALGSARDYCFTDTEISAGGGMRSETWVVFFERIEMRLAHSENIPFEKARRSYWPVSKRSNVKWPLESVCVA
jgi:hypothetical protein